MHGPEQRTHQEDLALSTPTAVTGKARLARTSDKEPAPGEIAEDVLEGLTEVFQMLGDRSRLKILMTLARGGEMHVSALCQLLGQSQPAVSHHLTLLRMNKLVHYRRDGKHNFYSIETGWVRNLLEQFFAESGNGGQQLEFDDFSLAFKAR
jgi:ArsR family transcriptional regulator